jgi:hypothetical protein
MAHRFLLAVLDKEGNATDKFEVIDFNYTNEFDPQVMKMNFAGLGLVMQWVREDRLMMIKKITDDVTVRFMNAHQNKKMFRALQFMIFRHHYRTKGLWNDKVVEDQWYLREFYTMTDVKVNNMAPRVPGTPPTDIIILDITGEMTTTAMPGKGKPMGAKVFSLPEKR